jgi:endogenous inhibitor of DNA gyrase (YacG/DUF329 family)
MGYKGTRTGIDKKCKTCGITFYDYPKQQRIFCSTTCKGIAKRGFPAWNLGIPMREESKKKLSLAKMGNVPSFETRRKISIANTGHVVSEEVRKKISIAKTFLKDVECGTCGISFHPRSRLLRHCSSTCANATKIGRTPWNKGKSYSVDRSHILMPKGEAHWSYKGERAGYHAIHAWLRMVMGSAKECSECGTLEKVKGYKKFFQWANLTGLYLRDVNDYKQMCIPCHFKYDQALRRELAVHRLSF